MLVLLPVFLFIRRNRLPDCAGTRHQQFFFLHIQPEYSSDRQVLEARYQVCSMSVGISGNSGFLDFFASPYTFLFGMFAAAGIVGCED